MLWFAKKAWTSAGDRSVSRFAGEKCGQLHPIVGRPRFFGHNSDVERGICRQRFEQALADHAVADYQKYCACYHFGLEKKKTPRGSRTQVRS